jgi:hypothetical protein
MAIFKTLLCTRRRKPFVSFNGFDNVELNKSRTMREQGSVKGGDYQGRGNLIKMNAAGGVVAGI